jgi:hypothetical protein
MPYIKQEKREVLNPAIDEVLNALRELESDDPQNDMGGNLNYMITKILMQCYGTKYSEMAQAVSVLEMAKLEYYRIVAAPYENQKSFENGAVE